MQSGGGVHTLMVVCHYYTIELVLDALLNTHPLGTSQYCTHWVEGVH